MNASDEARNALGSAIDEFHDATGNGFYTMPDLVQAIVAAGWVPAVEYRRHVLEEAAQVFQNRLPDGTGNGRAYNSYRVAAILRDMAAIGAVL